MSAKSSGIGAGGLLDIGAGSAHRPRMKRAVVLALVLAFSAGPVAADEISQAPCAFVSKRNITDEKARHRCGVPDGEVGRSYKRGRWIVFVT